MFCTECGKEIDDGARFCEYCGNPIELDTEMIPEMPSEIEYTDTAELWVYEEPVSNIKNSRMQWVVPVCIAVCVVFLGGIGVFAVNIVKSKENNQRAERMEIDETQTSQKKKTPKAVEQKKLEKEAENDKSKSEKGARVAYPQEIVLDAEVQNKLEEFVGLLSHVDTNCEGNNFAADRTIDVNFAALFLFHSIYWKVPFAEGHPVDGWSVSEAVVRNYLKTSIGIDEFMSEGCNYTLADGMVVISPSTPSAVYGTDTPRIRKAIQLSETDIQVFGSTNYMPDKPLGDQPYIVEFAVTLTVNPESIWGGYTLKSIDKWAAVNPPSRGDVTRQAFHLSASSVLQESGYDHSVSSLMDENTETCWVEGVPGTGEGESITFSSDETKTVSGLAILPGFFQSEDLYRKNGHPEIIEITAAGRKWRWNFGGYSPDFSSPEKSMVFIDFGGDIDINECTVTLRRCSSGNKYDDTCITEMFLYKK